mmetsp:Transcript_3167/g.12130  ORF Transcript_3167/g.12130 Transcript_3167/m.12130 type:complete len:82 (-) Transcript_3167:2228-2473(-)
MRIVVDGQERTTSDLQGALFIGHLRIPRVCIHSTHFFIIREPPRRFFIWVKVRCPLISIEVQSNSVSCSPSVPFDGSSPSV